MTTARPTGERRTKNNSQGKWAGGSSAPEYSEKDMKPAPIENANAPVSDAAAPRFSSRSQKRNVPRKARKKASTMSALGAASVGTTATIQRRGWKTPFWNVTSGE